MRRLRLAAQCTGIGCLLAAFLLAVVVVASTQRYIVRRGPQSQLDISNGMIHFAWHPGLKGWDWPWNGWEFQPSYGHWEWRYIMAHPTFQPAQWIGNRRSIIIPTGPPFLVLPPIGIALIALSPPPPARRGTCPRCSYDLKGLPKTTTLCPECGGNIEAS